MTRDERLFSYLLFAVSTLLIFIQHPAIFWAGCLGLLHPACGRCCRRGHGGSGAGLSGIHFNARSRQLVPRFGQVFSIWFPMRATAAALLHSLRGPSSKASQRNILLDQLKIFLLRHPKYRYPSTRRASDAMRCQALCCVGDHPYRGQPSTSGQAPCGGGAALMFVLVTVLYILAR